MSALGKALITKVREIAEGHPGFLYEAPPVQDDDTHCMYVYGGEPSCLLGRAAWDLRLIDASINRMDNVTTITDLAEKSDWDIDEVELNWLSEVQDRQDFGETWGESVKYADREWDALYA